MAQLWVFTQFLDEVHAIHHWHFVVSEYGVDDMFLAEQHVQRFLTVTGLKDVPHTKLGEEGQHEQALDGVVIDNEDGDVCKRTGHSELLVMIGNGGLLLAIMPQNSRLSNKEPPLVAGGVARRLEAVVRPAAVSSGGGAEYPSCP